MPAKTNKKNPPKRSEVKRSSEVIETHLKQLDELIRRLEAGLKRLDDQAAESDPKYLAAIEKADSLLRKIRTA